jgi:hypothetical protein
LISLGGGGRDLKDMRAKRQMLKISQAVAYG